MHQPLTPPPPPRRQPPPPMPPPVAYRPARQGAHPLAVAIMVLLVLFAVVALAGMAMNFAATGDPSCTQYDTDC